MLIFISYQYLWVDKENSDAKKNQWSIINFLSNFRMGKTFPWKVLIKNQMDVLNRKNLREKKQFP